MPAIELVQFRFSHYNEKARWALDHKRIPHTRRSLLPGPHLPILRRMTGGTQVPVLRIDGELVIGSSAILARLEADYPERPLYPERPEWRARALEVQRLFDEEVGAEARRALFLELLQDARYAARCFTQGFGAATSAIYGLAFPMTRAAMRRAMDLDPGRQEAALTALTRGLDFVAEHAGPDGFLVGDRFSIADLTAASLLQLVSFPRELEFGLPEPRSPRMERWLARWSTHPGAAWVTETYRAHRPASAEVAA
ncbi:MAG: glutathione S-transferase family protein [Nannocystaceae bacterium]